MNRFMRVHAAAFGAALFLSVAACSSDGTGPEDQAAPPLPPLASMETDFSFFASANGVAGLAGASVGLNWLAGATSVSVAQLVTVVVMTLPVATFSAAAQNSPTLQSDGFHWVYSVSEGGQSFSANLRGQRAGEQNNWDMRISATGTVPPLEDFLWYSGSNVVGGASGVWHIYDATQPGTSVEVLRIDWTDGGPSMRELVFTNVKTGTPETGDRLTYEIDGQFRIVRFFDASENTEAEISWNEVTLEGYITAPNFRGGVKACWDAQLNDVACSN